MALFTYEASGSLSLGKCGIGYSNDPLYLRGVAFTVGDQAWLRYKAEKGILEYVVIKKIRVIDYGKGVAIVLWVDTFNAVYNEWDLIYYADAVILVENYLARQRAIQAKAECLK